MNLKPSFGVIGGGGEDSKWPISFGSNINSYKQLSHENQDLRHTLQVIKSLQVPSGGVPALVPR